MDGGLVVKMAVVTKIATAAVVVVIIAGCSFSKMHGNRDTKGDPASPVGHAPSVPGPLNDLNWKTIRVVEGNYSHDVSFVADEPLTVRYLVYHIGGVKSWLDGRNAYVKRVSENGTVTNEVKVNLSAINLNDEEQDVPLEAGDTIVIPYKDTNIAF